MNFNNVCISLHEYFSSKGYGKILLPLSVPICLGSAALKLFSRFISLGNLVTAILFFAFSSVCLWYYLINCISWLQWDLVFGQQPQQ